MTEIMINTIFTTEERKRLQKITSDSITVDVHGLSRNGCRHILRNISAVYRGKVRITVIHGYNHGTVLKDAMSDESLLKNRFRTFPSKKNQGVTVLDVA